ncbi:unnamed protein product [Ectocarpus sp. CCAP 1310/34]|nr:unnamed protein product [Ectocarpus sp. CCAP 1310/34]
MLRSQSGEYVVFSGCTIVGEDGWTLVGKEGRRMGLETSLAFDEPLFLDHDDETDENEAAEVDEAVDKVGEDEAAEEVDEDEEAEAEAGEELQQTIVVHEGTTISPWMLAFFLPLLLAVGAALFLVFQAAMTFTTVLLRIGEAFASGRLKRDRRPAGGVFAPGWAPDPAPTAHNDSARESEEDGEDGEDFGDAADDAASLDGVSDGEEGLRVAPSEAGDTDGDIDDDTTSDKCSSTGGETRREGCEEDFYCELVECPTCNAQYCQDCENDLSSDKERLWNSKRRRRSAGKKHNRIPTTSSPRESLMVPKDDQQAERILILYRKAREMERKLAGENKRINEVRNLTLLDLTEAASCLDKGNPVSEEIWRKCEKENYGLYGITVHRAGPTGETIPGTKVTSDCRGKLLQRSQAQFTKGATAATSSLP